MKKNIAFLCGAALLLSVLGACGTKTGTDKVPTPSPMVTAAPATVRPTETAAPAPTTEPAATNEPAATAIPDVRPGETETGTTDNAPGEMENPGETGVTG